MCFSRISLKIPALLFFYCRPIFKLWRCDDFDALKVKAEHLNVSNFALVFSEALGYCSWLNFIHLEKVWNYYLVWVFYLIKRSNAIFNCCCYCLAFPWWPLILIRLFSVCFWQLNLSQSICSRQSTVVERSLCSIFLLCFGASQQKSSGCRSFRLS